MRTTVNTLNLTLCLEPLITGTGVSKSGRADDRYNRDAGKSTDDQSLTTRASEALRNNPEYPFDDVNVDVLRGAVQLSGFVKGQQQKARAADIARRVRGVKIVVNNISVKPR